LMTCKLSVTGKTWNDSRRLVAVSAVHHPPFRAITLRIAARPDVR
jgi:hypothetical protein